MAFKPFSRPRFTFGDTECIDICSEGLTVDCFEVPLTPEQVVEIAAGIRCVVGTGGDFEYSLSIDDEGFGVHFSFCNTRILYENNGGESNVCTSVGIKPGDLEGIAKAFEFFAKQGGAA